MQAGQIIKNEKVSLLELPDFRAGAFQTCNLKLYTNLQSCSRFFIKHLPIKLKKQSGLSVLEKENKSDYPASDGEKTNCLRIEICAEKINALLAQRHICAADIRCLDTGSKQCLRQLCLNSCLYNPAHSNPASQLLENLTTTELPLQVEKR